jgi:predicted DNA-binding protein
MTPLPGPQPRQRHYSMRRQPRLDAETSAQLEALASSFHRKRAAILRYAMQWGLAHTIGWTLDPSIPDRPHLVHLLVSLDLLQQVQAAAAAYGASVAAWLRHAMRQVTPEDFPASWHVGETSPRSHDSGHCQRRFILRLDDATSSQLKTLTQTLQRSAAEVIRQLIIQASSEDFPESWRMRRQESQPRAVRQVDRSQPRDRTPEDRDGGTA